MSVDLPYQLINITIDYLQFYIWLTSIPMYSGYCFYCFFSFFFFFFVVFSLCLQPLLLPLLHQWLLCATVLCLSSQLLSWPPPWWDTSNIGSTWCGSSTTTDAKEHKRCCWPYHCAAAATSVPDASSGIYQLSHGSSTGKFLFQSLASYWFA